MQAGPIHSEKQDRLKARHLESKHDTVECIVTSINYPFFYRLVNNETTIFYSRVYK